MERRLKRHRGGRGGIAGLADLVHEFGGAIEYDLMTHTRYTLDDLGGALTWRALLNFVTHVGPQSALAKSMRPELAEMSGWLDGSMVAPLIAELIDCTNYGRWEYATSVTPKKKKKPKEPKPVPRPWAKSRARGEKRIGRDPIPISEFESWWRSRGAKGQ